ncbi:MAG: F0F1 ATP synthase subunit B [Cystobacterineae bacterium]|nr:F0F1 ATP synthase subunit B [Cystobacterineae bacterium]
MPALVFAAGFMDVRPGLIIWTLVTFIIVAILLRRLAWGPLLRAVEGREQKITDAIESAKRERAEAEKLLAEQKAAMTQVRQEAAEQLQKAQESVARFREELMAKSRLDAEAMKADAARAIEEERQKAVLEMKAQAASLALTIAERLLEERMDDAKQKQLAEWFANELGPRAKA